MPWSLPYAWEPIASRSDRYPSGNVHKGSLSLCATSARKITILKLVVVVLVVVAVVVTTFGLSHRGQFWFLSRALSCDERKNVRRITN